MLVESKICVISVSNLRHLCENFAQNTIKCAYTHSFLHTSTTFAQVFNTLNHDKI
jgi:hypothetical protein